MEELSVQELLNKNLAVVKVLERKAKMFGNGMLVLSLLDVIFGVLAIFCTSLQLTALFASATSLTAITICGRVIQVSKIRQLQKSLEAVNLTSMAWFVNRYNKSINKEKIKMTKATKLQKVLTTILAVFGVGGVVVYFFPQFTSISEEISKMVAMASEVLAVVSGIWLSTTSDKVLTAEEIAEQKKKVEEKEAEKIKKQALKELKLEEKKEQLSKDEKVKEDEKAKAEAEYRAKVEAMKSSLKETNK